MRNFTILALTINMFSISVNAQQNVVTDVDGNFYNTIEIGSQTWMAENLKTTRYNDETPIPNVIDNSDWSSLSSGAYCWYNNDSSYKNPYGALYNWYAVNQNICPVGWHVPTSMETIEIESFLGDFLSAGGNMKSPGYEFWLFPNTGATNKSGFSAVASGQRSEDGTFSGLGYHAELWRSDLNGDFACTRSLFNNNAGFNGGCFTKRYGFSVRFIKDVNDIDNTDLLRSLIAYYPFNGNANDVSGNNHHGTAQGVTMVSDRFGVQNNALSFSGKKNTLSFSGHQMQGSATTLTCWIMVTDENTDTIFFNTIPYSLKMLLRMVNNHYELQLIIGDKKITFLDESDYVDINNPRFDFLSLTYDGTVIQFKINERIFGNYFIDRRALPYSFPYTVKNDVEFIFNGALDDLHIYNRALDDEEINLLYWERTILPSISTSLGKITQTSVEVKSIIDLNDGGEIIKRGICWSTSPEPDTTNNITVPGGAGSFQVEITGLNPNTKYYVWGYAVNDAGINYSVTDDGPLTFYTLPDLNYGKVTDIDGNEYRTIRIGTQTWMAENLKTTRYPDGTPLKLGTEGFYFGKYYFIYNDDTTLIETNGLLYSWHASVNSTEDTTFTNGIQGVCPDGWHIPSYADKFTLIRYLGGPDTAGGKLKDPGFYYWAEPNTGATNETGFSARGAGIIQIGETNGIYADLRRETAFWTSEAYFDYWDAPDGPYQFSPVLSLEYDKSSSGYFETMMSRAGASVRCLKDTAITPEIRLPEIKTNPATGITHDFAILGSELISNGGELFIERGICWSTNPDPDTSDFKKLHRSYQLILTDILIGLMPATKYYVRAFAINSKGLNYGNEITFTTKPDLIRGTVMDIEGNTYKTVKIGTQNWMAENLKTTRYADGTPIPLIIDNSQWISFSSGAYCWYNNDSAANANKYGALYNWYTVNADKLCPIGWKVPSDNDWRILENYLIKNGFNYDGTLIKNKIAKSLSSAFDWSASDSEGAIGNADYPTKRNITDFTALPGGFRNYLDGRFVNQGQYGCFWTATENEIFTSSAWYRLLYYDANDLRRQYFEKTDGFSVRCLKQLQDSTDSIDLFKGLIAYYPFNGNANDESGFYHHGTVNGATLTNDRFDNPNSAYYFNGQGNSISVNSLNIPSSSSTISCWVKNNTAYGIQNYISKHEDASNVELLVRSINDRYAIEWTIGSTYFVLSDSEGLFTIDPENPRFDLLVLVYDSQQVRFYVNNILIASHNISGQIANNNIPLVFGRYAGSGIEEFFNGTLDEVRIYNRALNEKEINALYNDNGALSDSSPLGDIDFNRLIQSSDAALALQYSVGLDPLPSVDPLPWESARVSAADVDNQNGVTAYDASLILQYEAGLINSFPAEDSKKSFSSPPADVEITLENGFVTFRSQGELFGLNLTVSDTGLLGTPEVTDPNLISAVNISSNTYSLGLATANAPQENNIILKIPVLKIPDTQITVGMKINNEEKQLSMGMPTHVVTEGLNAVDFYPNPTHTMIYFKNLTSRVLVTLYDLHGKKVIESNTDNAQLDVSILPAGIYFLKLKDENHTLIRKLVKQDVTR